VGARDCERLCLCAATARDFDQRDIVKVLVAEDDPVSRHLLKVTLSTTGYETSLVADGAEALRVLEQEDSPKLVILDWMMPHMDGVEVCRAIRMRTAEPYVYIILLTAKGHQEEINEGLEAGADDYITKPFDLQELKARLRVGKRILELHEQLVSQATHDSLTSLLNRSAIFEVLQKELIRSVREKTPVTAIMTDLDHFKHVNDAYGHLAGDAVLREAGRRLSASLRAYDAVGRYGGEEFLVVAPSCSVAGGAELAERLRESICGAPIDALGHTIAVTMSFGVAASCKVTQASQLLHVADEALYAAKEAGRNRVEVMAEFGDSMFLTRD
jgi:two-component system cell cycle response regulator